MKSLEIRNHGDLLKALQFDTLAELSEHLRNEIYPVTIEFEWGHITLRTDADRVPFTKVLYYPYSESDYEDALVGLQCVTDYAMHEGYDNTHEDLFKELALRYAENHGIIEYKVNKNYMEYWSLYEEGFYFIRIDLNTCNREEVCHLPWTKDDDIPVPAFLLTREGHTLYNYFEG